MSELREMIEKTLKEMDALDMKISVEKYQEEIGANDKENIGVLSDGTRYYKKNGIQVSNRKWLSDVTRVCGDSSKKVPGKRIK